jgi:signal transduction histidine kinase
MNQKIQGYEELLSTPLSNQERVQTLCRLAYQLRNNHPKRAFELLAEARSATLGADFSENFVENECVQGVCHVCQAMFDDGLTLLFRALQHAQQEGFQRIEAETLRWIGISYVRMSMHTTALEYFTKSQALSEDIGETLLQAQCRNNMGDVYIGLQDFKTAMLHYRDALRDVEAVEDTFNHTEQRGLVLHNIATTYRYMQDLRPALLYHQQSLVLRRNLGDATGIVSSMAGMAEVYMGLGQFDTALTTLFQVLDMALQGESQMSLRWSNWSIGALYLRYGKPEKALRYLRQSLEESADDDALSFKPSFNASFEVHKSLAECYKQTGDMEKALFHFEKYHAMREETASRENKQALQYLQRSFEMEKARAEAEIYRLRTVELAQLNQQLEHRQRILEQQAYTIELANTALHQQNETLNALNAEKNELMGIVSHDLKNPIGVVRTFAELIENQSFTGDEVLSASTQIVQTSDRMLELVKNLLDINRLESGGAEMTIVSFDIAPVTEIVAWHYASQAEAKQIRLHFSNEAVSSIALAFADEQALQQVLDNIISNAVKYSPQGKNVFVRVKSGAASQAVRVEVADEGPGISEADMKKMFGKFARLSAQPTGGEHSTGLGLSIVKRMVEAMNGRVWCESEFGKGATFIVELPAATL